MMVFHLGYTAWSIAFRILTMVVRLRFVQQQYSKADVEAASEELKKGHNIAGDMRTQLLDAGRDTINKELPQIWLMPYALPPTLLYALGNTVSEGKKEKNRLLLLAMDFPRTPSFEKVDKLIPALRSAACRGRSVVEAAPVPSRKTPSEAMLGFSP
jgi:hypothetical protein